MLTWYRCRKHKGTSNVSYSFTVLVARIRKMDPAQVLKNRE